MLLLYPSTLCIWELIINMPYIPREKIDYQAIGYRLRAYRIASSLKAEDVAESLGISRAAVYRLEKGEIVKIETLDNLARLLNTSLTSLLGINTEYYSSANGFFERMRQLETQSSHIYTHFEPFSYLLTSDCYDKTLVEMLTEASPLNILSEKQQEVLSILKERKKHQSLHSPYIYNLISQQQIEKFLYVGMLGSVNLTKTLQHERKQRAKNEILHLIEKLEQKNSYLNIAIISDTMPSLTFQLFYQNEIPLSLAVSPFRLVEFPNVSTGIATVTSSTEAIFQYQSLFDKLWLKATKGRDAINLLKQIVRNY